MYGDVSFHVVNSMQSDSLITIRLPTYLVGQSLTRASIEESGVSDAFTGQNPHSCTLFKFGARSGRQLWLYIDIPRVLFWSH